MKRTTFITGIVVAALSVTAVAASAKGQGGKHRGMQINFEELDTNGDGFVTQAEMDAHAAARFAKMDTNGDGALSADELEAAVAERAQERAKKGAARMIEHRDANGDGVLSQDEMKPKAERSAKMFDRLDSDGDGQISKEEFEAAREKMRHGHKGKKRDGDRGGDN
ncbi:EF-hand domain-containing protein [Shimia abyssi]|uniref:EF hand domain-containing protein n=1 Tax=Shimia abyssi TaxID=1662395 RepID=A0A2P8FD62_9RHOB|nr:EF-hand domain-containing protein [Shimia abyssi]PSL19659.1 EF hand domain-containing protein [Shimia abyssi]